MADALHNLSDVAALLLAWLGMAGARLPATKRTTYGFKRVEVMTAFVSAVSLVVIAIFILMEAYDRFMNPQDISHPVLFLTIAVIGLLGNVFSVWILSADRHKSLNMKAAFLHMAYDTASSGAVIIGGIAILFTGWTFIDPVLSAIIAIMIVWSSWLVIKDALLIFLEAVPAGIDFDEVHAAILNVEHVDHVHDLHIWSISSTDVAMSCHVSLPDEQFDHGPEVIDRINNVLGERFGIHHCTIQLEKQDCVSSSANCHADGESE